MPEHLNNQLGEIVYVLGTPGSNTVKIGRTTNLPKRLADIQRMSPVPLTVLWTHPGGHELETSLHRHFKAARSHGEWFAFEGSPVDLIREAVATRPWLRPRKMAAKKAAATTRRVIGLRPTPSPAVRTVQFGRISQARDQVFAELNSIVDPMDRYRALERVQALLRSELRTVRQGSVLNLKQEGRTWQGVGKLIGVSGARAEQISRLAR